MKKTIFFILFSLCLANIDILFVKDFDIVVPSKGVELGDEGFVVRKHGGFELIGYSCIATKINEFNATFACKKFDSFHKKSMPTLSFNIKNSDTLMLEPFSNRAIIISPSLSSYQKASKDLKSYELTHPDIFANFLATRSKDMPSKDDFKAFCKRYYISKIILDLKNERAVVACASFHKQKALPHKKNAQDNQKIRPFFKRFEAKSDPKFDFDKYYKGLIGD